MAKIGPETKSPADAPAALTLEALLARVLVLEGTPHPPGSLLSRLDALEEGFATLKQSIDHTDGLIENLGRDVEAQLREARTDLLVEAADEADRRSIIPDAKHDPLAEMNARVTKGEVADFLRHHGHEIAEAEVFAFKFYSDRLNVTTIAGQKITVAR